MERAPRIFRAPCATGARSYPASRLGRTSLVGGEPRHSSGRPVTRPIFSPPLAGAQISNRPLHWAMIQASIWEPQVGRHWVSSLVFSLSLLCPSMGEKGAPVVILECFSSRHCIRHSAQPSCADKLDTPISFLTIFSRFVTAGLRRQPRQQCQPQSNGYALGFHDPVFLQLTRRANALQRKRRDAGQVSPPSSGYGFPLGCIIRDMMIGITRSALAGGMSLTCSPRRLFRSSIRPASFPPVLLTQKDAEHDKGCDR